MKLRTLLRRDRLRLVLQRLDQRCPVNPRKLLRVARWEVATGASTLDRKTLLAIAVVLLAAGAATPASLQGGGFDEGIYRVHVADADSPYRDAVASADSLRLVEDPSRADVVIVGPGPDFASEPRTPKQHAARSELRSGVQSYNVGELQAEVASGGDEVAAFPVEVDVRYAEQEGSSAFQSGGSGASDGTAGGGTGDGGSSGGSGTSDGGSVDAGSGDGGRGGDGSGSGDGGLGGGTVGGGGGSLPLPDVGGRFGTSQSGTPAEISAPFPFGSLVLAFLFVVPMNFVVQAYASTIMDERLNRRGELLLVTPVGRGDIVGGKTLPYAAALVAVTVGIAALIGGGPLSVLAVLPVAAVFLALSFVGAMFARSYKELTFVTVAISVLVTSYVFIPAIFTEVEEIALISPLTLVVLDLQNEAVGVGEVAFSIGPFLLASAVLYGLGLGVYREEDMFTQLAVHRKALDALAAWISRPWHVGAMSAVLLPFVFVLELLAVALVFALPRGASLPAIVLAVAVIEEVAKSVHVYAAFEHERFSDERRTAVLLGVASGAGFFVAEKATHAIQLVGLDGLEEGVVAFTPSQGVGPLLGVALFVLPLVLHCTTAIAGAIGARAGGRRYLAGLAVAVAIHAAYNLGVIALVT